MSAMNRCDVCKWFMDIKQEQIWRKYFYFMSNSHFPHKSLPCSNSLNVCNTFTTLEIKPLKYTIYSNQLREIMSFLTFLCASNGLLHNNMCMSIFELL